MNNTIEEYSKDLVFADWATQFKIGLSSVMKYFNYARLLDGNYLIVTKDAAFKKSETLLNNQLCIDSVSSVRELLIRATGSGTLRLIVQRMIDRDFTFKQGAVVDRSIPLAGQPYNIFNLVN